MVEWRGLELRLPDGWIVFEHSDRSVSAADAPLGSPGDRGEREAAVYLTHQPGASPDDWRQFVSDQDGVLEQDRSITLDGVPASRLVFTYTTNGIPLREMVVVIPSREVVALFQPVVTPGSRAGPDRFASHLAEFDEILSSIEFGAPPGSRERGP